MALVISVMLIVIVLGIVPLMALFCKGQEDVQQIAGPVLSSFLLSMLALDCCGRQAMAGYVF